MNDFSYPQVQRINVEENYFGDLIKDPYRWLEETDSLETKKFIEAENDLSSRYIQSCPYREKIKQKLKELFQYPRYGCPFKKGTNYFMQINSGLQNQFVLYMMHDSLDAEPKVFFDPNTLSTDGTVSLSNVTVKFSNDGKLWAYGLQKSGSDWNTIKIRDVDTGKDLDDELIKVKFSGISWTKDDKGFFYSYYPNQSDNQCDGQETTECNHQKLFYHRINTSQSEDVLVFETPDHPHYNFRMCVSDCGQFLNLFISQSCQYNLWYYHKLDDPFNPNIRKNMRFEPIVSDFDADYYFIANDGPKHYIRTNWNAPNFRVIAVDLSDPQSYSKSSWQDLIPEHPKNVLDSVDVVNHNILVCHYIADVISRLELRKLEDGSLIREIKIP
ncbi:prolyl oligopeptidase-like protein, partial [Sarcoptes scabiei]